MPGVRLLIIQHPGRVTRFAMSSLAAAAREVGLLGATIEAGPIWDRIARAGSDHVSVRAGVARELEGLCRRERITHVLGYVGNLTFDFGLFPAPRGSEDGPSGLFPALGIRHLMLWTDHPEWAQNGAALDDPYRRLLAHPMHTHFVKSGCAALECGGFVLGWRHVHAIDMAEDPALIRPQRRVPPVCDAVAIMSDAAPVPEELERFLADSDPDPSELARAMLPAARAAWRSTAATRIADATASERLFDAWAALKLAHMHTGLSGLARSLGAEHAPALESLRASPRAWYGATASLRRLTAWRRHFWPEWLARRRSVEFHGGDGSLGHPASVPGWVGYEDQPHVYARGSACLTINAGHDEEGMTHKAFQIAASGGALVHHRSSGVERAFEAGIEAFVFDRGPELLDAVDRLRGDEAWRAACGDAARSRLERDHSWRHRLMAMLDFAQEDEARDRANQPRALTTQGV